MPKAKLKHPKNLSSTARMMGNERGTRGTPCRPKGHAIDRVHVTLIQCHRAFTSCLVQDWGAAAARPRLTKRRHETGKVCFISLISIELFPSETDVQTFLLRAQLQPVCPSMLCIWLRANDRRDTTKVFPEEEHVDATRSQAGERRHLSVTVLFVSIAVKHGTANATGWC